MREWMIKNDYKTKLPDLVWNSLSCMLFAGQMAIVLMVLSRWNDIVLVGIINIGYAIANLILTIGRYGVRNYQVTDRSGKYSFRDYLYHRYVTVVFSFLLGVAYLFIQYTIGAYSNEKIIIILEIIALKSVDGLEGVYFGQYQKNGYFIVGAKISAIHQIATLIALCGLSWLHYSIHVILINSTVVSLVSLVGLTVYVEKDIRLYDDGPATVGHITELIKECFPLCVGTTLAIYVGNIPKYAIDWYLDESVQAYFGYIMLPVFVVTLLSQFIYQPFVKKLGDFWEEQLFDKFRKNVLGQCGIVFGLSIAVLIGSMWLGIPLLNLVYGVDLSLFKMEFFLLLIGGSLYAAAYYLTIPITVMRKQGWIAYVYVFVAVVSIVIQKWLTVKYEMLGAAILYVAINGIVFIIFGTIFMKQSGKTVVK